MGGAVDVDQTGHFGRKKLSCLFYVATVVNSSADPLFSTVLGFKKFEEGTLDVCDCMRVWQIDEILDHVHQRPFRRFFH